MIVLGSSTGEWMVNSLTKIIEKYILKRVDL